MIRLLNAMKFLFFQDDAGEENSSGDAETGPTEG